MFVFTFYITDFARYRFDFSSPFTMFGSFLFPFLLFRVVVSQAL